MEKHVQAIFSDIILMYCIDGVVLISLIDCFLFLLVAKIVKLIPSLLLFVLVD